MCRDGVGRSASVIGWIVGWSLRSRGVVVVAAALLVVGATRLRDLPVDMLPEFSPPTVEVQTEALGLSAAEAEQLITVPLEQDLLCGSPTGRSSWPR
jgi:Cu/Ag efflux pump CusA